MDVLPTVLPTSFPARGSAAVKLLRADENDLSESGSGLLSEVLIDAGAPL